MRTLWKITFVFFALTTLSPADEGKRLVEFPIIRSLHEIAQSHRARSGLREQDLDEECCQIAQQHANWMASRNTMAHGPNDQIIAYGYDTPQAALAGWMGSSGHRAWVLSGSQRAGWGAQQAANGTWYWCGVFRSKPVDASQPQQTHAGDEAIYSGEGGQRRFAGQIRRFTGVFRPFRR